MLNTATELKQLILLPYKSNDDCVALKLDVNRLILQQFTPSQKHETCTSVRSNWDDDGKQDSGKKKQN